MTAIVAAAALAMAGPSIVVNDLNGKKIRLPIAGKPTVLFIVGTECPIANRMAPELKRIVTDYKGIAYFFVYSEKNLTPVSVRKHLRDFSIKSTGLLDTHFIIAKFAKARVTPEAALFDATGNMVYHGRINDSYVEHNVPRETAVKHDLRKAISEMLNKEPVANPFVPAVGCTIPYED